MAYDQLLADRVQHILLELGTRSIPKKMMGGLCFMIDDKMCVAVSRDKRTGESRLIARIGEGAVEEALKRNYCSAFSPTGRVMKDFVCIMEVGISGNESLKYWIERAIDFNPKARSSKKT